MVPILAASLLQNIASLFIVNNKTLRLRAEVQGEHHLITRQSINCGSFTSFRYSSFIF